MPTDDAVSRACEGDRRWFAAHPARGVRLRQRAAGEFRPLEGQAAGGPLVLVVQIQPGLRVRFVAPPLRAVPNAGALS
jgi:hypothetical protein